MALKNLKYKEIRNMMSIADWYRAEGKIESEDKVAPSDW